jgi:hypothetical protein
VAVDVVVEPEERLDLEVVAARRIAEVQVVDPLARLVGGLVVEPSQRTERSNPCAGLPSDSAAVWPLCRWVRKEKFGAPKSWRGNPLSTSRWFSNRTSAGFVYSALILGPGNVPLNP